MTLNFESSCFISYVVNIGVYPQICVCSAGVWNPVFICAKQVLCQLNYSLSLHVHLSHFPLMPQYREAFLRRYQEIIGGCDAWIYEVELYKIQQEKTQDCLLLHVIQLCNFNSYLENHEVVGGVGTWSPAEINLFVETVLSLLVSGQIDTVS